MEEEVEVKKVAKSVNSSTDFPNYEDLIEDLSSWQDILKTYTSGSAFKNTYTTIKKRYAEATVKEKGKYLELIHLFFSAILPQMKYSMYLNKLLSNL